MRAKRLRGWSGVGLNRVVILALKVGGVFDDSVLTGSRWHLGVILLSEI